MNTTNRPLAAKIAILAVLVAVPAAACTDYVAATTTTTAAHLDAEAAVMQLVDTRCEREARCNIFGSTAYSNRNDCKIEYRRRLSNIGLELCTHGVNRLLLDRCVSNLERQKCEEDMGPISAFHDCARSMCAP